MSTRREFLTQAAVATFIASSAAPAAGADQVKAAPGATATTAKPRGAMKTYTVPHTDLVVYGIPASVNSLAEGELSKPSD